MPSEIIPNKELRKKLIENANEKKLSHVGSALSCLDFVNYLYDNVLLEDDIFILSKGHGAMALYTALERKGKKPQWNMHPEIDEKNGIYATTGSLGHGFPIALGRAFAKKFERKKGKVYVLLGDGEMAEGSIWETLILANRFKLDNLHIFVDWNKYGGLTDEVKELFDFDKESLAQRIRAFGFKTTVINGHDENELKLIKSFNDPKTIFILDTVKGKGVDILEKTHFHGYLFHQNPEEYKKTFESLS